jgi:hypothetical protein
MRNPVVKSITAGFPHSGSVVADEKSTCVKVRLLTLFHLFHIISITTNNTYVFVKHLDNA